MDNVAAVNLLRRVSIFELSGTDGCLCMNCEIQGVSIDVSCRKSSHSIRQVAPGFFGITVRVHSRHMDASTEALQTVADEVAAQLKSEGYDILVRLCDYKHDDELLCLWCDKPRTDVLGYYCDDHKTEAQREAPWKALC